MKNMEKWPTFFRVVKMVDGVLSNILSMFLLVGVVNENQLNETGNDFDLHAKIEIEHDKYVIASLVGQEKLEAILATYRPRASRWRGQYQALAKAIVDACEEALG